MDGILLVDKPAGYTSHDIVAIVKRAYKLKKVGHTGTLDPLATGILPLCINAATKLAERIITADKAYETTLQWGIATDTYDSDGQVVMQRDIPKDVQERLSGILPEYIGKIQQTPPPYSAVKVDGKPLYWWARQGQPRGVPAREITIHNLEVVRVTAETTTLKISCSKGTFIRSLVHDMGVRIGCGAHVIQLRRTVTGIFDVADAISLEEIKRAAPSAATLQKWLIPIEKITLPSPAP